ATWLFGGCRLRHFLACRFILGEMVWIPHRLVLRYEMDDIVRLDSVAAACDHPGGHSQNCDPVEHAGYQARTRAVERDDMKYNPQARACRGHPLSNHRRGWR